MNSLYSFSAGTSPLLVSMPHSGVIIPKLILNRLSESAKTVPDTDWHIPQLYDFVRGQGHSVLRANYSRYVVDLNRPPDNESLYPGQAGTGLCPDSQFNGAPLYFPGEAPNELEITSRRETYWQAYHDKIHHTLSDIKSQFGYAILYDAHSIASRVPRLFDGQLPDLNLGTANGTSCAQTIQAAISHIIEPSHYSSAINGRFQGGYITRHYGDPHNNIHALQMEIAQGTYMQEHDHGLYLEKKAEQLRGVLKQIFLAIVQTTQDI